ncbi:MAG: chromosome segregation protein SMC [Planctomycetota bacterium]
MRLKRLVARGFKSFADRTEFEFDSRLTGIIGPNGCGKSNVVDAIKWVLGDQRAKSLRGSEMTDVIFKGAEGRDAMGMAEVTITFEDPNGQLDGRTEIDISRRLTLEKESSYLLNGQEVRLKDVRDVLLDTGLGTGGYSVMEQGRIDAVLSANPEARRAIFEEAAGISRFKLQKKESLRKLERTDQNLARVTDLLEERSRRIRSLRIQAGKARRYRELQAALRDLRAAVAVVEGRQLRELLAQQRLELQELERTLAASEDARVTAAERVRDGEESIARAAAALDAVRTELHRCRAELAAQQERAQAQEQRQRDLFAEAERGRQRGQNLANQRVERSAVLETAREDLTAREQELVELHRLLEEQRRACGEIQQQVRGLQRRRETVRGELLELLHERTRARNAAAEHEARILTARGRRDRLDERLRAVVGEVTAMAAVRARSEQDLRATHTHERILIEREQLALEDLQRADAAAAELAAQEANLRHEWSQLDGRRQALAAMEAQLEGLDQGPRHVLATAPPGLRGRLVDLLEVDLAHSAALEAALGHYVQALVVDTRAHAAAILSGLREGRHGRALLLVEEDFGVDPGAPAFLPLPPGARPLLDLVRPSGVSESERRLLGWLLRGVVLVDSLEQADPARADLCFVTADGAVLCGPRVEGGVAADGHAGLVVRRSQIQELTAAAAGVEERLTMLLDGKERAVTRVERLKLELRQLGVALQGARREAQASEAQLSRMAARSADLEREAAELEAEERELGTAIHGALARLGRSFVQQVLVRRREEARAEIERQLDAEIGATEAEVAARSQREQELRLQQVQAGESREGLLRTIRMHEDGVRELDAALEELAGAVQHNEDGAERAGAEAERLRDGATVLQEQIADHEQARQAAEEAHEAVRLEQRRQQDELSALEQRCRSGAETLNQRRLSSAEQEHRFTRLEERLREDTGVELLRCLGDVTGVGIETLGDPFGPTAPFGVVESLLGPALPPDMVEQHRSLRRLWLEEEFQPVEAKKEVQLLQSQRDRLGAVNLDAVAELDQEEGQFGTLEQEVQDLKEARRALMETLRKLEVESKVLFEQTFAEARKNFQEIFRKLFQGGKADMFLGETEDLLEAGIEIVAQPPGKQLQSINLLSGGERSLTAVAILFALFKVRPSPFCILDEVDAALDETNVERFLRVLRDFTHDTQFCIVTHHKRTMADCQALYGITMQRRGVSSRIAVSLHEVESFQETGVVPASGGEGVAVGAPDPARKQRIAGEEQVGF